jgi:integrase
MMPGMEATAMQPLSKARPRVVTQLDDAYAVFRLERQGNNVTPRTLEYYDQRIGEFIGWLGREAPDVERVDDIDISHLRAFRAYMASRTKRDGNLLQPETLHASHRCIHTFLAWAEAEGYRVDGRMLRLPPPKRPRKEPTLYHIAQLRTILAACERPEEALAARLLVGSGVRISELAGLAVRAPDGLGDLMLDSLERGRAELRVRWDAGAKGRRARRVPITPQLALAVKRYIARDRPRVGADEILINAYGRPYRKWGIDAMMDRLEERVGFHVHAHGFRHTFATVATQMGWNLERVRAAMGHADYSVLMRYVFMSTERDLGPKSAWAEYIATP